MGIHDPGGSRRGSVPPPVQAALLLSGATVIALVYGAPPTFPFNLAGLAGVALFVTAVCAAQDRWSRPVKEALSAVPQLAILVITVAVLPVTCATVQGRIGIGTWSTYGVQFAIALGILCAARLASLLASRLSATAAT